MLVVIIAIDLLNNRSYYDGSKTTSTARGHCVFSNKFADGWSVPDINGPRPEPCGDVTVTSVAPRRAVFHGGYERMRVYLIDLDSDSVVIIIDL